MNFFLTYDVSFFSIFLLTVLLLTVAFKKETNSTSGRLFIKLILINIMMLTLEIISWQFDQKPGNFNWYANYISNMLFAWLAPLITCMWASYIDYQIYHSYSRLRKHLFFMYPMFVNTLFIIINFFTPFIFSVSPDNIYSREKFMWLIVVLNTIAVIYIWIEAYKNRNKINQEVVIAMLAYIIFPAIAAGIQVLVYGAFIIWPVMAVTIVISYIYLETVSTSKDYLTKLMSRQRIDTHIDYRINTKASFGLAVVDLNQFKAINDQHGHNYGDQALITFAKALKSTFNNKATIARYGGDEFIIITPPLSSEEMKISFCTLSEILDSMTIEAKLPFSITYSYGYHIWNKEDNYSYKELFNIADNKMYKHKQLQENEDY